MSRFFPNGGNGNGKTNPYHSKPGEILPLFDKGYLKYDVRHRRMLYNIDGSSIRGYKKEEY
jgi:hypothetical protein